MKVIATTRKHARCQTPVHNKDAYQPRPHGHHLLAGRGVRVAEQAAGVATCRLRAAAVLLVRLRPAARLAWHLQAPPVALVAPAAPSAYKTPYISDCELIDAHTRLILQCTHATTCSDQSISCLVGYKRRGFSRSTHKQQLRGVNTLNSIIHCTHEVIHPAGQQHENGITSPASPRPAVWRRQTRLLHWSSARTGQAPPPPAQARTLD
jgi:hypothetical protein